VAPKAKSRRSTRLRDAYYRRSAKQRQATQRQPQHQARHITDDAHAAYSETERTAKMA